MIDTWNQDPSKESLEEVDYRKILDFMRVAGERLLTKTGNVVDIGVTKINLTEEDLAIERGFRDIIQGFKGDHALYAEEEHDSFHNAENVWVVDPISGTKNFIDGSGHYAIVISHLINGKTVFAAVFDPSANEFFTAKRGKGAFLNGTRIGTSEETSSVIFRPSSKWNDPNAVLKIQSALEGYQVESNAHSMAVDYCWIAAGRFDGMVSLTKDSFPEFAGGFIVQEAGGRFTNLKGESDIQPTDRVFVCGNQKMYDELLPKVRNLLQQ